MTNQQNPLAEGFIQGIQFDAKDKVEPCPAMSQSPNSQPDFESIAKFYKTCSKTIRRWNAAGVDLESPMAVARHVLDQSNPSPDVLDRISEIFD